MVSEVSEQPLVVRFRNLLRCFWNIQFIGHFDPWIVTMRSPFLLSLLLVISACSPFVTSTPPPPPQPIQIAYTPTLRPFVERLHQCALEYPEIGIITLETSITELDVSGADLTLWFGEPPQDVLDYAFSIGMDEIVIIAGTKVGLGNVTTEQLRDLYTSTNSTYQVWTYGENNDLRNIFENSILGGTSTSSDAMLAPNPAAMIEAITMEPTAIGYLPRSWLSGDHQTLSIERDLQTALTHPVLALTHTEPEGNLHTYLACLQNPVP
jgi:hypothetical protein